MNRLALSLLLTILAAGCKPPAEPPPVSAASAPAAAATTPPAAASPADAPPTVNGLYAAHGACPFEGCDLREWKATARVDLREMPDDHARIVATLPAGEWAHAVESVAFLFPKRGVAIKDAGELKTGDVIYLLDHEGEGVFRVWRRGEMTEWTDDGERDAADPAIASGVKWDTPPNDWPEQAKADEARGVGWWVKIKRAGGESGWARVKENFNCTDRLGGEPECETHQTAPAN